MEPKVQPVHPPKTCTLYVCTSCRPPGTPRDSEQPRPGFVLYQRLRDKLGQSALGQKVEVRPAECLSLCSRPCGIALCSPGSWTYLFGDQNVEQSPEEIAKAVDLYLEKRDGFMVRAERPKGLRSSILGRVPPTEQTKGFVSTLPAESD